MTPILSDLKDIISSYGKYDEPYVVLCKLTRRNEWDDFLDTLQKKNAGRFLEGRTYLQPAFSKGLLKSLHRKVTEP